MNRESADLRERMIEVLSNVVLTRGAQEITADGLLALLSETPERERRCEHGEMMIAPRCSKCSLDAILGRDLTGRERTIEECARDAENMPRPPGMGVNDGHRTAIQLRVAHAIRALTEREPFPYYCCVSCGTRLSGCDACETYFTEQPSP